MDPLVASTVMAASGVGVRVTTAVCQYLRLRWRVRHEQAHRETLVALARSLPEGSRFHEVRGDGSSVSLTLPQQGDRPAEQET
ncbi:hypothetical protein EES41_39780 (plasmid) [Streptomyces sp. ADI95-16]|uniref:hypothetical protein n=1 Tax=Streptomyces sp. ADI95-16 TaxID=1522758 RepID=UPI000F3AA058|nr:hypothetical protein [Streptomyces sp. ADI95-16]AYV32915.1 hypothetical protein EES41_39780 [Streptomyces sp. ADI95-16]